MYIIAEILNDQLVDRRLIMPIWQYTVEHL